MALFKRATREWTEADSALWYTSQALADICDRKVPSLRADTLFALREKEVAFASGQFALEAMRATGDGSYVHNSTIAFGTGAAGLAMTAGVLVGAAMGNASRRAQAMRDAQVCWRAESQGILTVTSQGFYLQTATSLLPWTWNAVDMMAVDSFNVVVLFGQSTGGAVTWRLQSVWSELVFVLWSLARHPNHPQLRDGSWLPPGWAPWAEAQGYALPAAASQQ